MPTLPIEQIVESKVLCLLTEYRAIAASSIGLYFRVPESNGSDGSWNEPPAAGLA